MKKNIGIILIIALFLSSIAVFADIDLKLNGHWVEKAINKEFIKAHFNYLIKEDTISFNPENKIDKRNFMYSLYSMLTDDSSSNTTSKVGLVVEYLKTKKIIEEDTKALGKITRKEAVKYIVKTLELSNEIQIADPNYLPYKDIQGLDDEYKKYVLKANMIGIIKGYGDSTFRPEENITIAEAIVMLQKLKEELGILKNKIPFKTIEGNAKSSSRKAGLTVKTDKNKVLVTITKEFSTSGYSFTVDKVEKKAKGKYQIYLKVNSPNPESDTLQVITYLQTVIEIDKNLLDSNTYEFELIDVNVSPETTTEKKVLM